MSRFSLTGKCAFVTGGSRGIGRAIAIGLADAGADVAFSYHSQHDEAETTIAEIERLGRRATAVQMDVTDRASVEAAAKDARGFGAISILVNNAGINKPTDYDQITDEDWDSIIDTNLKGPFVCAQVFLPLLKEAGGNGVGADVVRRAEAGNHLRQRDQPGLGGGVMRGARATILAADRTDHHDRPATAPAHRRQRLLATDVRTFEIDV